MENDLYEEGIKCLRVATHIYDMETANRELNTMKEFINDLQGLTFTDLQNLYKELENVYIFTQKERQNLVEKINMHGNLIEWRSTYLRDMDSIIEKIPSKSKNIILDNPLKNIYSIKNRWLNSENVVYDPPGYLNDVLENIKCYLNLIKRKMELNENIITKTRKEERILAKQLRKTQGNKINNITKNEDIPRQVFINIGKSMLENNNSKGGKNSKRKTRRLKKRKTKTKRHNKKSKGYK